MSEPCINGRFYRSKKLRKRWEIRIDLPQYGLSRGLEWKLMDKAANPAGRQGERGDGSCYHRSTVREEGIRLEEIGMLTGLGRPNKPGRMGERLGSIIPLEELTTGTPILDMRTLPHIKLVMKFSGARRAAHGPIPYAGVSPSSLMTAQLYAIPHRKGCKIFLLFLLTSACVPPTISLLLWSTLSHGTSHSEQAPISLLTGRGFVVSPYDSQQNFPSTLSQRAPWREQGSYGICAWELVGSQTLFSSVLSRLGGPFRRHGEGKQTNAPPFHLSQQILSVDAVHKPLLSSSALR